MVYCPNCGTNTDADKTVIREIKAKFIVDQSPLQKGYDYAEGKVIIIVFAPTEVKAYKCKSCGTVFAKASS